MAWDFATETVRVLTHGLDSPPDEPTPGVTFPAAVHRTDRYGAVLFLRLWRDGQWDSDTATTELVDGQWAEPSGCGGGGWLDPYDRPAQGWDGEPLVVLGAAWQEHEHDDGSVVALRTVVGMAAASVASIRCESSTGVFRYDIDSRLGAFVIVAESSDPLRLTPYGESGAALGSAVEA